MDIRKEHNNWLKIKITEKSIKLKRQDIIKVIKIYNILPITKEYYIFYCQAAS